MNKQEVCNAEKTYVIENTKQNVLTIKCETRFTHFVITELTHLVVINIIV
jgi:hypothetical protein